MIRQGLYCRSLTHVLFSIIRGSIKLRDPLKLISIGFRDHSSSFWPSTDSFNLFEISRDIVSSPHSYAYNHAREQGLQDQSTVHRQEDNFWLWSPEEGYDLTRPANPDSEPKPSSLRLECQVSNITIDPAKSALLIIDLQNFTLSQALRTNLPPEMFGAEDIILTYGIPAARKAGIQVVWLNWGLDDEELKSLPPQQHRVFGWKSKIQDGQCGIDFRARTTASAGDFVHGGESRVLNAPGDELGEVTLEDGSKVDAGRALFKGTWNAALHDPLATSFNQSQSSPLPDVLFHKNRNSSMGEAMTECTDYLVKKGIRTLLFTGMNTDQCVLATIFNAQMKGFDTILLNDGCVTDSPAFAQQGCEYQFAKIWGFLSSCKALAEATTEL